MQSSQLAQVLKLYEPTAKLHPFWSHASMQVSSSTPRVRATHA